MTSYDEEAKVDELIRRYKGQISVNVRQDDAFDMAAKAINLMKEWNPILSSVADLKEIMGAPTVEDADVLEYKFDNGIAGNIWRYTVLDEIIVGVEYVPLA